MEKKRETNVLIVTIAVFVATFMTAIEGTIVTTAMPTIVGSLHGIEIMNWVFSIYLLTNAMFTPIYGKLADKIGRRSIFIFGTLVFIIGSAMCGFSNTMLTLIISRAIQGIGAGAMMPVALTILADMYSAEKRAKMLGLNSTAWGIASVVGPLTGGVIVDTIGWHWIFFINVPIGLVLIGLVSYYLVEEKQEKDNKKMDIQGSLFLMTMLLTLLLAFQFLSESGFDLKVIGMFGATILSIFLFIRAEKNAEDPVISLELFSSRIFIVVNLVAALISGFLMAVEVYIPMWMQGVLGYKAGLGGLVLAPLSILWVYGSSLVGRWMVQHSMKTVLLRTLGIALIGGVSLLVIPMKTPFIVFLVISGITGIGVGGTIVATTVQAQNSVGMDQLGVATSFNTLSKTIGQTVMVSVFGLILNTITRTELAKAALTDDPDIMNKLVNPQTAKLLPENLLLPLREILHQGLWGIYVAGVALVLLAIGSVLLLKKETI
ncbi:MDR family MFS transporter [Enterococcus aquimarinus]|uniref:Drug:H+ antiporter-2 (14 Spanner) (DHA2) family drug resistance MFS transporter n=1 Tax=Enterococcus aquimarinus TaxID=328396 RepID=A0A1L8QWR6_9ENTE|nr:MDR family MFS transporter [Enterococcus aquimarinus]OJG11957.1 drug:H+ antiporter-2 (14 Spanner) (DHA2) family drug resistance MFS transporter [Enterococcus aquimarinus]